MTEMNYNREISPEILAGLQQDAKAALTEIIEKGRLKAGDLFVIGCSSSEMLGSRIGTDSSMQAAEAVFAKARNHMVIGIRNEVLRES